MLDSIAVDYYGSPMPVNQVANISVLDARTLTIQPWEKNMLQPIEKAIIAANIGVTPQNDGAIIRISIPPLTEERRKELVKRCQVEGEHSKVATRNIRRDAIESIKKLQKSGLSEDAAKDAETSVQQVTDKYISQIEKHLVSKGKGDYVRINQKVRCLPLFAHILICFVPKSNCPVFFSRLLARYTPDRMMARQNISTQFIFSPSIKPQNKATNGIP